MPITMGGMASGVNTDDVIQKLVELEARPIQQWVDGKNTSTKRKETLDNLKSRLQDLNNSANDLYGFRASYDDKKVGSSNNDILQATASSAAEKGTKEIEVVELASTHKISSDPIKSDDILPAGKLQIEVNGESETIKFAGGDIKSLSNKISEKISNIISSSLIKTSESDRVLTLESKIQGKKGEILLSGDKDLLNSIGMIKGEKGAGNDKISLIFDKNYFMAYEGEGKPEENGSFNVVENGRILSIEGILWKEYLLPVEAPVKKETILELNIDYKIHKEPKETYPDKIVVGPDEQIIIKGIDLKGYNVTREREIEKKIKDEITNITGVGIVSIDNGKRTQKIYERGNVTGKQVIPFGSDFEGKKISKIIFYCNEGSVEYSNIEIITPVKGTGLFEPKNEIKKASDAKIKVDGVEVVRDSNDNLNDIIKGLSLSLRGASKTPVRLTIESDTEKAAGKIKKFIKAYNDYLDYNKEITKVAKVEKPGDYEKSRYQNGPFVGDMTILNLENSLKKAVGDAYPNRAEDPIRILVQCGISTGEINAAWESIKEGKLFVDDTKLQNIIINNPVGIKEFFGSDTDGDNRTDNGLAYRISYLLKPYLMSGKNIIVSKIDLENESIKQADDKIERHQEHLKKYEAKLREKFAAMEKSISGAKAQGNWMKSQMDGLQGNKNEK